MNWVCFEGKPESDVQHFHFAQRFGDGIHGSVHIGRIDVSDAAHTECFDLGQFAGVKDESLGFDTFVERFELIARVVWSMKGDDNRRLYRVGQEAAQPQFCHVIDQCPAVVGIALMACRQAAFFAVLQQRFMQCRDHMGRRGEAPLAGLG